MSRETLLSPVFLLSIQASFCYEKEKVMVSVTCSDLMPRSSLPDT